jgi:hypothetical protein
VTAAGTPHLLPHDPRPPTTLPHPPSPSTPSSELTSAQRAWVTTYMNRVEATPNLAPTPIPNPVSDGRVLLGRVRALTGGSSTWRRGSITSSSRPHAFLQNLPAASDWGAGCVPQMPCASTCRETWDLPFISSSRDFSPPIPPLQELSRNADAYRASAYMHMEKGGPPLPLPRAISSHPNLVRVWEGKLRAGPVWDLNLAFGGSAIYGSWLIEGWQVTFVCMYVCISTCKLAH